MSSVNQKSKAANVTNVTHEGAPARRITPEQELARTVSACLLWEDNFYENGENVAERINKLVAVCDPELVKRLAVAARSSFNLRHVPLLLGKLLVKKGENIKNLLAEIIQRPDELTEFLAMYWENKKIPLDNSIKKGLAAAFKKFDAYQLAKYNRTDKAIKLRDVLFLSHAKPRDQEQADLWKKLINDELEPPDTWEVSLSGGKDKKETFTRLIKENKLGGLALLRNLRNMEQAGVDRLLIRGAIATMNTHRILPFRFIAAAKHAPGLEDAIEQALLRSFEGKPKIEKKAIILVDVSGSMDGKVSNKSDIDRLDAACGVAMCAREMFRDVMVFSFSNALVECPPRRGFALKDAIVKSQPHSGTYLGQAVKTINEKFSDHDVLMVFTDEQSADTVPNPLKRGYMINVASYKNGVGYGHWDHIDGFSESIMTWVAQRERETPEGFVSNLMKDPAVNEG